SSINSASNRAQRLAWAAYFSQAPVSSSPTQGAERKRILDASCPACLQRYSKSSASARLKNRIASLTAMPFLVPPKQSTSTPAFQLSSAGDRSREAQALAKRAPSICRWRFSSLQVWLLARSSAG